MKLLKDRIRKDGKIKEGTYYKLYTGVFELE